MDQVAENFYLLHGKIGEHGPSFQHVASGAHLGAMGLLIHRQRVFYARCFQAVENLLS